MDYCTEDSKTKDAFNTNMNTLIALLEQSHELQNKFVPLKISSLTSPELLQRYWIYIFYLYIRLFIFYIFSPHQLTMDNVTTFLPYCRMTELFRYHALAKPGTFKLEWNELEPMTISTGRSRSLNPSGGVQSDVHPIVQPPPLTTEELQQLREAK